MSIIFQRNDMVEYFGEQLSGFAFTANCWVQSYRSRCVKPSIIYGDVSRPKAMTVSWSSMAQEMTKRPMKGMLTGRVTILNWSFVRNNQPRYNYNIQNNNVHVHKLRNLLNWIFLFVFRFETCYEVEDLEKAGITVIQIDEAALREGLPLRKAEHAFYLDWAAHSFRITNVGVVVSPKSTPTCATPTSTTSSTPSSTWMLILSLSRTHGLTRSYCGWTLTVGSRPVSTVRSSLHR